MQYVDLYKALKWQKSLMLSNTTPGTNKVLRKGKKKQWINMNFNIMFSFTCSILIRAIWFALNFYLVKSFWDLGDCEQPCTGTTKWHQPGVDKRATKPSTKESFFVILKRGYLSNHKSFTPRLDVKKSGRLCSAASCNVPLNILPCSWFSPLYKLGCEILIPC